MPYGMPFKFTVKPLALATVDGTAKTVMFNVSSGVYTTVSFQTAPANKATRLAIIY